MSESVDPLEVLLDLTHCLAEGLCLEEALQATADAALSLLPADHASLRLFDDARKELMSHARAGAGSVYPPATFRSGEGVLGIVADTGRPALLVDTEEEERFKTAQVGFDIKSLVAVPLLSASRVVGVLSASSAHRGQFSPRDLDLAQLLANCTAPFIETARLARLSITDDLTLAYNYRYLGPRLEEEVERAKRHGHIFSVLMADLDHFKRVNDSHGHAVGDEVLRHFVQRVRLEVRQLDVLIRRGGEEFFLLMPSTSAEEAYQVAERIRLRVAASPIDTSAGPVPLTVSLGVATWRPGDDGAAAESRADGALYRAKDLGRNQVYVACQMHD